MPTTSSLSSMLSCRSLWTSTQTSSSVGMSFHAVILILIYTVAAGFDAAVGDQLGGCFVTPSCYAHMTHMLKGLAGGKLVVCLEVMI